MTSYRLDVESKRRRSQGEHCFLVWAAEKMELLFSEIGEMPREAGLMENIRRTVRDTLG